MEVIKIVGKPRKVEIVITDGHNHSPSVKRGASYISVDYNTSTYGGASPCDNEDEVKNAIVNAKETIQVEGDIPVIVDKRVNAGLLKYF